MQLQIIMYIVIAIERHSTLYKGSPTTKNCGFSINFTMDFMDFKDFTKISPHLSLIIIHIMNNNQV